MTGIIGAFFGALGFGMMYHLEGKKLLCTALCGALGQLVCVWMRLYTGSPMAPMLAAAFCVTVLAQTLARTLKAPVTVFLVCALIPLVPGKGIYQTLLCGLCEDGNTLHLASVTLLEAGGIVAGCALGSGVVSHVDAWRKRKRGLNV